MTDQYEKDLEEIFGETTKGKPMQYKKITTNQDSNEIWDFEKNKSLEGVYTSTREVTTKMGPGKIHDFELPDHSKVSMWGSTMINNILGSSQVPVGSQLRITFEGKKQGKRGMYKAFSVELAE